ncbi:MAG: DUF3300 domain-containing protein [Candidatus Sulfotelmatobacter sp.]
MLASALLLAPMLLAQAPYQGQSPARYEQGSEQPQPYGQQPYAQPSTPEQNYPQQPGPQPLYPAPGPPAQNDQQQSYAPLQPLSAQDLEQLVAPIALYPDTLVAQILAASTYPAQVADADRWRRAQGYATTDQIAAGANAMQWDPSVKALTAFPQVLAQMDQNLHWTSELGDAYFNQPQDVLEAVQVMRGRAQRAGNLNSTPQEAVTYDQGNIVVAPANPQVVYVPAYNPWSVYGQPVSPYPGFSVLGALGSFFESSAVRFGLGIALNAFARTPWGWLGWGLSWLTQSVLFQGSNYYSHSATVAHWGLPYGTRAYSRGGTVAGWNRFSRPGYGSRYGTADRAPGYARTNGGYSGTRSQRFARMPERDAYAANRSGDRYGRGYQNSGSGYNRTSRESYNSFRPAISRSEPYGRSAYGSTFNQSGSNRTAENFTRSSSGNYGGRPSTSYSNSTRAYRAPSSTFQRSDFGRQSSHSFKSSGFKSAGKSSFDKSSFSKSSFKPPHSGGFHLFGGGHAPKISGGGKSFGHGHSGGGGHSGGKHHH